MNFARSLAISCATSAAIVTIAGAQGSISGSVYDSLSARGPLANATVVLVERNKYATTDAKGRFKFDSVPDGHYSIGFMHAVLDSFDLQVATVPVEVSGNRPATVQLYTPSRATVALMVMRARAATVRAAAKDSATPTLPRAQALAPVAVNEKAPTMSLMERDGWDVRRAQGLGSFITDQDIATHGYSDLASVLQKAKGVQVEFGPQRRSESGISQPMPFMRGMSSTRTGVNCLPNYFLDGSAVQVRTNDDFQVLSAKLPPVWIKGIEVYSNPGTIPAQYDLMSSTGCGSIVIWTR